MRVVHNANKGDDDCFDRLFSYFQSQFSQKIVEGVPIRKNVFLVKTAKQSWVLKGYQSINKLKLQEAFTATLRKEGFSKTYRFLVPPSGEPPFLNGLYFGCIEYIPPNQTGFSFRTQRNRQEGLTLLNSFHETTARFAARYQTLLSQADLYEKWIERFDIFCHHRPFLRRFIDHSLLSELVSWGNWSLEKMSSSHHLFTKEPKVILHGDVAHHNFLRAKNGELYLIDFDLIAIGPPVYDYLQYANRILFHLDWSLTNLWQHKQMKAYLSNKAFLSALAYPADIYREWNRLMREKSYTNERKVKQVIDLSLGQFFLRKKFVQQIQRLAE
ncbi:aminoglycoside phosphotransferase family protein [Neobacillus muris]|uniref:aminoglycoside phosphotransferase family protein n=1 Tax=Neobacillus muris TaxID=2941334 RepID=UPI00203C394C|nr:aminoglycoside phosphotransferase family protein [Neobacillus muris]